MDKQREMFEQMYATGDCFSDAISLAKDEDGTYEQALARLCYKWFSLGYSAVQPEVPAFFKDIIIKLEFSAQQSELWEEPEDISAAAIQYRALALKLEQWMLSHNTKK